MMPDPPPLKPGTQWIDDSQNDFRWADAIIAIYKQSVDRTLLRENLKLTPDERVRKMMAAQRLAIECMNAGKKKK